MPNDLEYLDVNDDVGGTEETDNSGGIGAFLASESFFVNFLSYTKVGIYTKGLTMFVKGLLNNNAVEKEEIPNYPFSDPAKLKKHISNLLMVDSVLKAHQIKMLIVSFPFPGNDDKVAEKYYNGFIDQLKINHFNFMDANTICQKLPLRQQIVSKLDMHPSVQLQKMVADSIYKRLIADSWIQ
ncbi:MAG: hypothetical protein U0U67_17290 [Chitinophagales bacterium]